MSNGYGKYIIGIVALILFVVLGVKLFQVATKPKKAVVQTAVTTTVQTKSLPEYAGTNAQLRITIDGPVTSDENHRAIRITVDRDQRVIDVIKGYQGLVIRTKSYDNTQSAFEAFLRAVNGMSFTKGQKGTAVDPYVVCPLGTHYSYELLNTGSKDQDVSLWSVSCGITFGTFAGGTGPTIRQMFKSQIPDYVELTQDISVAPLQ